MFNNNRHGKIVNEKFMQWCQELSCFQYDIVYRPGKDNVAADGLSRICWSTHLNQGNVFYDLHYSLCYPGITRLYLWERSNTCHSPLMKYNILQYIYKYIYEHRLNQDYFKIKVL